MPERQPLINITSEQAAPSLLRVSNTREELRSTQTSELVIALCGPIGSPIHQVANKLEGCLTSEFGYERCEKIRLSEIIREHKPKIEIPADEYGKIKTLIKLGDDLS
jgi:hypothetical protein